jgi:tetratricopeptide (TPR) repeat protein
MACLELGEQLVAPALVDGLLQRDHVEAGECCADRPRPRLDVRRVAEELALKGHVWDSASARVRFRIVTNIGAAHLELGEEELAAHAFLEAVNYDPDDRIGMANVALAHILRGELERAVAAAEVALRQDPGQCGRGRLPDLGTSRRSGCLRSVLSRA